MKRTRLESDIPWRSASRCKRSLSGPGKRRTICASLSGFIVFLSFPPGLIAGATETVTHRNAPTMPESTDRLHTASLGFIVHGGQCGQLTPLDGQEMSRNVKACQDS